jgi:hypothetical protein
MGNVIRNSEENFNTEKIDELADRLTDNGLL